MKFLVQEFINGLTVKFIKDNGRETACTARGTSVGQMEKTTKVISWKIEDMAQDTLDGLMAENMKDNGLMESNMDTVIIKCKMEIQNKGLGRKEKGQNGVLINDDKYFIQIIITFQI